MKLIIASALLAASIATPVFAESGMSGNTTYKAGTSTTATGSTAVTGPNSATTGTSNVDCAAKERMKDGTCKSSVKGSVPGATGYPAGNTNAPQTPFSSQKDGGGN